MYCVIDIEFSLIEFLVWVVFMMEFGLWRVDGMEIFRILLVKVVLGNGILSIVYDIVWVVKLV